MRLSQPSSWFQLAKFRVTGSSLRFHRPWNLVPRVTPSGAPRSDRHAWRAKPGSRKP